MTSALNTQVGSPSHRLFRHSDTHCIPVLPGRSVPKTQGQGAGSRHQECLHSHPHTSALLPDLWKDLVKQRDAETARPHGYEKGLWPDWGFLPVTFPRHACGLILSGVKASRPERGRCCSALPAEGAAAQTSLSWDTSAQTGRGRCYPDQTGRGYCYPVLPAEGTATNHCGGTLLPLTPTGAKPWFSTTAEPWRNWRLGTTLAAGCGTPASSSLHCYLPGSGGLWSRARTAGQRSPSGTHSLRASVRPGCR